MMDTFLRAGAPMTMLLLLSGCLGIDQGERTVDPPERLYLTMPDQALPVGIVGEPYEAFPEVSGGVGPYRWGLGGGEAAPGGLSLDPDGRLFGVPTEAGEHVFSVIATDSQGRSKRALLTLAVVLEPTVLQCGDTLSGTFSANAVDVGGPDLADFDNIEWLAVALPNDLTQRIELQFGNSGVSTLYVERASEPVGSANFEDHYVGFYLNPGFSDMVVRIDPGTTPSLSGYEVQPYIPMLLAAQGGGSWDVEVVCTDGPVFERLEQYPTELGHEIEIDYEVWGSDADVRIFPLDELPAWMIWDEDEGSVSGTAAEPGAWEFTIVAEASDGRRREERSIIGVYEVHEVTCDSDVPVEVGESYYEGEFYGYWDPKGYQVHRLDLTGLEPSAVDLLLTGSDGHYLGTADPAPDWLNFYAGAERAYVSGFDAEISVSPLSYPAIGNYLDDDQLYIIAGTTGFDTSMTLSIACDAAPRPDMPGLPVVEPLVPADYPLRAIGGSEPYTWTATGLPSGLSVAGGTLSGTTGAVGTFDVTLTVEDKLGASSSADYVLYVGLDEACAGATRVACNDSIDGTFTTSYYSDGSGAESTRVFCIVDRTDQSLGWEVYADDSELRVDVADPGATVTELLTTGRYTYVSYVAAETSEGVAMNPWSWPDLDDYQDLPVFLSVRAYEPGDWTVHLTCE